MPVGRTLVALLVLASVGLGAETLKKLDGTTVTGEVVGISDKEVVLRADGSDKTVPVEQVLQIDLGQAGKVAAAKYSDVELTDGSLLHCTQVALKGNQAHLTLTTGQQVQAPLDGIAYIVNDAQDAKVMQEWKELLAKKRSSDLLARRKDGELITLKGTFGEADKDGKEIQFDLNSEGSPRPVPIEKLHGLAFLRKLDPNAPPVRCTLLDTQAGVVKASSISVTADGFAVTTPTGVKVQYAKALVSRLDYSRGKLTYLSDLDPVKVIQTSTTGEPEPYRRDKNLDGSPGLRPGKNKRFDKGLAVHAYTLLEYQLDGEYREFSCWLGIDEQVGGSEGPVVVKIEGDGKEIFAQTLTRKDDLPVEVRKNIKDVQRLRITVSSGELLDLGKHVDLADAKVSK
jgi:hypothetical protein